MNDSFEPGDLVTFEKVDCPHYDVGVGIVLLLMGSDARVISTDRDGTLLLFRRRLDSLTLQSKRD